MEQSITSPPSLDIDNLISELFKLTTTSSSVNFTEESSNHVNDIIETLRSQLYCPSQPNLESLITLCRLILNEDPLSSILPKNHHSHTANNDNTNFKENKEEQQDLIDYSPFISNFYDSLHENTLVVMREMLNEMEMQKEETLEYDVLRYHLSEYLQKK